MKLKGVLIRCVGSGKSKVCKASEVKDMTPWQMSKSYSRCQALMREDQKGTCKLVVAYDQDTKRVIDVSRLRFNY
jgi:hypothetical protein